MTDKRQKKLRWCKNCNVPLLGDKCQICDSRGVQIVSDLRPVFNEEVDLIENEIGFKLPARSWKEGLWKRYNTLWWDGKRLIRLRRDLNGIKIDKLYDYNNSNKIIVKENILYEANKSILDDLITEACLFIKKIKARYRRRLPIVSFSGGKDSTVVSFLTRKSLEKESIVHVFGDTTIEYPDTYTFIEDFQKSNPEIPFYVGKSSHNFFKMCELLEPPSRINAWCCSVFKTNAIAMVVNNLNGKSGVLSFEGIRRNESTRRRNRERIYINKKITRQVSTYPILNWKEIYVWFVILINNLSFNPAYLYGFTRVGCFHCPNNSPKNEYFLLNRYPLKFKKWMKFIIDYAHTIGKLNPHEYFTSGGWKSRVGKSIGNSLVYVKKVKCMKNSNGMHFILDIPIDQHFIERFKPFGTVEQFFDDKGEGFIVSNKGLGKKLFMIKVVKDISILLNESKVNPKWKLGSEFLCLDLFIEKNKYQLSQKIERQIRKYQVCVLCGACLGICPTNAIKISPHFSIDEEKCSGCGKCLTTKFIKAGCVAINSFQQSKRFRDVHRVQ